MNVRSSWRGSRLNVHTISIKHRLSQSPDNMSRQLGTAVLHGYCSNVHIIPFRTELRKCLSHPKENLAIKHYLTIQERLGVLAAPREVRSTFLIARLRSAGGFNL